MLVFIIFIKKILLTGEVRKQSLEAKETRIYCQKLCYQPEPEKTTTNTFKTALK